MSVHTVRWAFVLKRAVTLNTTFVVVAIFISSGYMFGATGSSALASQAYPVVQAEHVPSGIGAGSTTYTWGNGAYTRVPPSGFDFSKASPAQLRYYGIVPQLGGPLDLKHLRIAMPSGAQVSQTAGTSVSGNQWAGVQVSGSFWGVGSYYYEPTLSPGMYKPNDPCSSYAEEGDYYWTGLGNNHILQTGTAEYAYQSGGSVNDAVWYEAYPLALTWVDGASVRPGDEVLAKAVDFGSAGSGYDNVEFYIQDITTGQPAWVIQRNNYVPNGWLDGSVAETMIERVGSGSQASNVHFGGADSPENLTARPIRIRTHIRLLISFRLANTVNMVGIPVFRISA